MPEARIFAEQMDEVLPGKTIASVDTKDMENMMKLAVGKEHLFDFDGIVGKTVERVRSRGNTIHVKLSNDHNIVIGPEYGGRVRFLPEGGIPPKYHLKMVFTDGSILTVRNTGMGVIYALKDDYLPESYLYKRDFLRGISPADSEFTWERFNELVGSQQRQLKPLLVGKNAYFTGISNAIFQDVLYRAGVHPKRKAVDLTKKQLRNVFDAIKLVIGERLKHRGKNKFTDIFGNSGRYVAAMGPNMKDKMCPKCDTNIIKISHGGGHVYMCPTCQVELVS